VEGLDIVKDFGEHRDYDVKFDYSGSTEFKHDYVRVGTVIVIAHRGSCLISSHHCSDYFD
jgi:hypothetical protein